MKKLLSLLVAFALVFTLAACGGDETPEPEVNTPVTETPETPGTTPEVPEEDLFPDTIPDGITLQFWHAMSGPNGDAVQFLVDKFNAENEYGITVEATYQGGYGDLHQKLVGALTAGEFPHMAQAYGNNIMVYVDSEAIVPLNDYIVDPVWGVRDFEDIVEGYRIENSAYPDGMFNSLPFNKSTEVLYYNETFFMDNDLEVPTNWEELESVSKAITEITGKPAFGYDSLSNLFITWTQQNGGLYTTSDGTAHFNNIQAVEAVEYFAKGVEEGYFRIAGEDRYLSGPFNNQEVMMFIGSTSGSKYVGADTFDWNAAQVPMGVENKVIQQGSNMFMMESTEDEQIATFIFMNFLMETENTAEWAMRSGYLPVRLSARELPAYVDYVATGVNPTKDIGTSYDPSWYIFDPIFKESYDMRMAVETAVEEVVLGVKTAIQAIEDAHEATT
jgi:multiple sugar transport system substrate-binding protein